MFVYTVYWILLLLPAMAAFATPDRGPLPGAPNRRLTPGWITFGLFMVFIIGLRSQVGGDWFNYLGHLAEDRGKPLLVLLQDTDPGYKLLTWLSLQLGTGIYGVNTICAIVFVMGLVSYCRSLPRPWLALATGIPYLVIVVAMGYSRQGIALGLAMLGLLALSRHSLRWFVVWILLATTMHRSALLLLPIAALATSRNRILVALSLGMVGVVGYLSFIEGDVDNLYRNYIERGYESQGALIRLGMNAIAGGLFLLLSRRFQLTDASRSLARWMSLIALALLAAYFASPGSSTALDRMGLYLLPLQLFVFSHLPDAATRGSRKAWVLMILFYYAAVEFVWLNFAANKYAWLPYRNLLFL